MSNYQKGDRVRTKHKFLSDATVLEVLNYTGIKEVFMYQIKLDEPAPVEYAYNTDVILLSPEELSKID